MSRIREWLTPGVVIQLVVFLISSVVSVALVQRKVGDLDDTMKELKGEVRKVQEAQVDVVRVQERLANLQGRVTEMERSVGSFKDLQNVYNNNFDKSLARLEARAERGGD